MKRLIIILCLAINCALGCLGVAWSGDLQKGIEALDAENYEQAVKVFIPLAKNGKSN